MPLDKTLCVLVGEENPRELKLLARLMADGGFGRVAGGASMATILSTLETGEAGFLLLSWDMVAENKFELGRKLRSDQKLARIPVLVVLTAVDERKLAIAAKLGFRHFIVKPFNLDALTRKMEEAMGGMSAAQAEAAAARQKQANAKARQNLLKGLNFLGLKQFDSAITEFATAAQLNSLYPEAYLGLADSFDGKGDKERAGQFKSKAAEVHVRLDQDEEAAELYAEILKAFPDAPNPFKVVADDFKAQGKGEAAIAKYQKAQAVAPRDEGVSTSMSRTYLESGDKDGALKAIEHMLRTTEVSDDLAELFAEITGQDFYSSEYYASAAGKQQFLDEEENKKPYIEKRAAERVLVADFHVEPAGEADSLSVVNIGPGGIGFKAEEDRYEAGSTLAFELTSHGRTRLKKAQAVVVHNTRGLCGCRFTDLNPKQLKELAKICGVEDSAEASGEAPGEDAEE